MELSPTVSHVLSEANTCAHKTSKYKYKFSNKYKYKYRQYITKTITVTAVMDKNKIFNQNPFFFGGEGESFGIGYNNDHDLNSDHGDRASGR